MDGILEKDTPVLNVIRDINPNELITVKPSINECRGIEG